MHQGSLNLRENLEAENSKEGYDWRESKDMAYGALSYLAYQAVVLNDEYAKKKIIELSKEVKHG